MKDLTAMPPDAVYIGRPTRWGNPYKIGRDGTRSEVIAKCETWIDAHPSLLPPLEGKDLVCWCDPLPCHGHVYLRRANVIRAAVTGGRYDSTTHTPNKLSRRQETELLILLDRRGISRLAHGAAAGYDTSCAYAVLLGRPKIELAAHPVEPQDGPWPTAGHRRNRRMLETSQAQILIALPGGSGTAHCLSEALVMGLEVWEWNGERDRGSFVERKTGR